MRGSRSAGGIWMILRISLSAASSSLSEADDSTSSAERPLGFTHAGGRFFQRLGSVSSVTIRRSQIAARAAASALLGLACLCAAWLPYLFPGTTAASDVSCPPDLPGRTLASAAVVGTGLVPAVVELCAEPWSDCAHPALARSSDKSSKPAVRIRSIHRLITNPSNVIGSIVAHEQLACAYSQMLLLASVPIAPRAIFSRKLLGRVGAAAAAYIDANRFRPHVGC